MLSVPATKDQQLSPTFEVDETNSNDHQTTSTSSSPTSPTTPTWKDLTVEIGRQRKNSWEDDSETILAHPMLDVIPLPQKQQSSSLSFETPTTSLTMPRIADSDGDWTEEKPQVAIARSLSVTKAGSRSGLKPTRVNSKKRRSPRERVKVSPTAVPPPVPEKDAVLDAASEVLGDATSRTVARTMSRKVELQRDLSREIWGQHGTFVTENQLQEKKMLVPNVCVVDDIDARKSVYAVMDCV